MTRLAQRLSQPIRSDRKRLVASLLAALCLSACIPTPGEFCLRDQDCGGDLRCAINSGATRGVCTYSEGIPDAGAADSGVHD